ncbi:MAG: SPOR domain-containing protein [Parvularculaceae bacterium]
MSTATLEDDYEEFDEFVETEEEEDDQGLSGLVVLLMGVVMIGAIASVAFIAYQHGVKIGETRADAPYVTADPEPLKVDGDGASAIAASNGGREVYDRFEGAPEEPVEVVASAPEEPVRRVVEDPIKAIVSETSPATDVTEDAVADRIADLAAEADPAPKATDVAASSSAGTSSRTASGEAAPRRATAPTPASAQTVAATSAAGAAPAETLGAAVVSANALSGSHLVQVGAFGSDADAQKKWTQLEGKLGDYVHGKSPHVLAPASADDKYYRLRIGPFASADAARTYCAGLKERQTDCLVRAK